MSLDKALKFKANNESIDFGKVAVKSYWFGACFTNNLLQPFFFHLMGDVNFDSIPSSEQKKLSVYCSMLQNCLLLDFIFVSQKN